MVTKNVGHFIDEDNRLSMTFTTVELKQLIEKKTVTRDSTSYDLFEKVCKLLGITPREKSSRGGVASTMDDLGITTSELAKHLRDNPDRAKSIVSDIKKKGE